ncbi:hypothetical protein B0H11DRAFT_2230107 [Mycena galericulata]|nr:hypothetical protein B0H11DRAFT_2230107 [Mycena galericulata]
MSTGENWPFRMAAQVHISRLGTTPLFPSQSVRAFVSCAGLSHLSIRLEDVHDNSLLLPSVDTVDDASIDRPNLSWSVSTRCWTCSHDLANGLIDIQLRFATLKQLETYLFALSYVRYIQDLSSIGLLSSSIAKARNIVTTADDSYLKDLCDTFIEMRMIRSHACTMNDLPTEVISHIFLHCAASQDRPDRFAIPLLLLQTCSRWRIIAIGTASLWRGPYFALGRRYFADPDNHLTQMALWLSRAKSSSICLSLDVDDAPYTSDEIFDVARYSPSLFSRVQTLDISSPQSQLFNLLRGDPSGPGPVMPVLEFASITISRWDLECWRFRSQFCHLAPLLRNLTIASRWLADPAHPDPLHIDGGLMTMFPWSRLTNLTIQIDIGIYIWVGILSQCTSLRTGRFIVGFDSRDSRFYTPRPVTFNHLESLRVTFRGVSTMPSIARECIAHMSFPAIQHLHIAGFIYSDTFSQTLFNIPHVPTLRTLFLDVKDLPPALLQSRIKSYPNLEQLSFIVDRNPDDYASVFQQLQAERLRVLTISTPMGDDVQDLHRFATHATALAIHQASLVGGEFVLFGNEAVLAAVMAGLEGVESVEVLPDLRRNLDDFRDPFAIFPYSSMGFLRVRRPSVIAQPLAI